jgi:hypothetical protein
MKCRAYSLLAIALFNRATVFSQSTTITFDDYPSSQDITNGYSGLNWNNFAVENGITAPVGFGFGSNTGYTHGIVSGSEIAFNPDGTPASFSSSTEFTFVSVYLTAAWPDNTQYVIQGFLGGINGTLLDSVNVNLSTLSPTLETFDWSGIDTVEISSLGSPNSQIVMDNLTYAVPEPTTLPLLAIALAALTYRLNFYEHKPKRKVTIQVVLT